MAQTLTGPTNWGRWALWAAVAVVVVIVAAYLSGAFSVRDRGVMQGEGTPPAAAPTEQAPPATVPSEPAPPAGAPPQGATGNQPAVPPSGGQQQ